MKKSSLPGFFLFAIFIVRWVGANASIEDGQKLRKLSHSFTTGQLHKTQGKSKGKGKSSSSKGKSSKGKGQNLFHKNLPTPAPVDNPTPIQVLVPAPAVPTQAPTPQPVSASQPQPVPTPTPPTTCKGLGEVCMPNPLGVSECCSGFCSCEGFSCLGLADGVCTSVPPAPAPQPQAVPNPPPAPVPTPTPPTCKEPGERCTAAAEGVGNSECCGTCVGIPLVENGGLCV